MDSIAVVMKDKKKGSVNISGKEIFPCIYEVADGAGLC